MVHIKASFQLAHPYKYLMSRNYKINDQSALYFVTFSVVQRVDVFTRPLYKDILVKSFQYCIQHKGLEVYAYVIMTNHVHAIVGSNKEPISNIIRDFKRHTSKEILKAIEANMQESRRDWMLWIFKQAGKRNPNYEFYQFWQQNNHPIELNTNQLLEQKLAYIHQNPVKAGIVDEPEAYLYSSARNYAGQPGLLAVTLIE